ncbi:hypothetical protein [Paenibacillus tepidiphilus]|uniref:hypothetical protein n=1 Tax=Paenibacillus tepidiphilus TaxID=2608683 RepID=UPI0013A54A51|nr:hypothetical protein [Paenibacillus tepidiphilus]
MLIRANHYGQALSIWMSGGIARPLTAAGYSAIRAEAGLQSADGCFIHSIQGVRP